jgi:hypothetical protein
MEGGEGGIGWEKVEIDVVYHLFFLHVQFVSYKKMFYRSILWFYP